MIDPADVDDLQLEDVEDYNADYPPVGFPQADENIHTSGGQANKPRYRRAALRDLLTRNKWVAGFVAMLVLICIVMISVLAADGNSSTKSISDSSTSSSTVKHQPPIEIDPESLDPAVTMPLLDSLVAAYERHGLDTTPLDEESGLTPQRQAFYWLATDDELADFDHTETIQRYALAVFYYATNAKATKYALEPQPWVDALHWLSDIHACDWRGIDCNSQKHVISIILEENNLTGSLPQELALFAVRLTIIDLTTNYIYMEGDMFHVFEPLVQLESLILDDNWMIYSPGIPTHFKSLIRLEELRMSFNLLAGELETEGNMVLSHMTALTHLEIESNFLTGSMPPVISELTNLVYLYMRRNAMSFDLDFLKGGNLLDLYALWLDSNEIVGSIPTEIGLLTELASISITNSTLSGPIPTEMGNLSELRRLWLYDNQLSGIIPSQMSNLAILEVLELHLNDISGAMPAGVCASIEKSEFESKALTADCVSEVTCAVDCCTKCYD